MVYEGSRFFTSSQAFVIICFFRDRHPSGYEALSHCGCDFHLPDSDAEHLFMGLLAVCISSLQKHLVKSFALFLLGCLFLKTVFYGSFKLAAELRGRHREFPYLPTPTHAQPPCRQRPPPEGTFVTTDEPTLPRHHHPPKSTVYIKVHSWCCTLYGCGRMSSDMYPSLWYHTAFSLP